MNFSKIKLYKVFTSIFPNSYSKIQLIHSHGIRQVPYYQIFQYISNKMQRYTVYYAWKMLYMFRVVPPPITRSAYNCIYSIWYLSHRYCHLSLSWKSWGDCSPPNSSTIATGGSNCVTNTRCCRYSCMRSW